MTRTSRTDQLAVSGARSSSATRNATADRARLRLLARLLLVAGITAAVGLLVHPSTWPPAPFAAATGFARALSTFLLFVVAPLQLLAALVIAVLAFTRVSAQQRQSSRPPQ